MMRAMTLIKPLNVDGASRVYFIVGDPIAQVKSPCRTECAVYSGPCGTGRFGGVDRRRVFGSKR
ncbi:MAG: hypothetical protein RLZZ239_2317 [Pseudomonadota bacterium]